MMEFWYDTHQQCTRLKNSEVLADLGSHLSHLSESHRNDVEKVIHDFPFVIMTFILILLFCNTTLTWVMPLLLSNMIIERMF